MMELIYSLLPYLPLVWLAYVVITVVYRLYFDPLSKFPGPKLVAATQAVEFYYDVLCQGGGKYMWEIKRMHEKYGPIVRISPYEIHIDDPDYYNELYVGAHVRRANKFYFAVAAVPSDGGTFFTIDHDLHRMRRKAVNPFLSKQNVNKLLPVLWHHTRRLTERFEEFRIAEKPLQVGDALSAYGIDITTAYSFDHCYHHLDHPDFAAYFHRCNEKNSKMLVQFQFAPYAMRLMAKMPAWLGAILDPDMHQMAVETEKLKAYIKSVVDNKVEKSESTGHRTIIHEMMADESLPPSERSAKRLSAEALSLIGGQAVTTSATVEVILVHVLQNKDIEHNLRESLKDVMSGFPDNPPSLAQLEDVEYLRAVIHEGLRLSYGVSHQMQRIMPDTALRYGEWEIPPGTPVGMSIPFLHHYEPTFPDSYVFKPDRWIDTKGLPVMKHFVPFGRGSRSCAGINIAWAEMYLSIATLFRPNGPTYELFETDKSDVALVHDFFIPLPEHDSKRVRILVK